MPRFPRLRPAGSGKVSVHIPFSRPHSVLSQDGSESTGRFERRAMAIWPRLNHRALHRCHGNVARIAAQVAHRTKMTPKAIETLLADRQPGKTAGNPQPRVP